jgi:regulator of replication initiation timing
MKNIHLLLFSCLLILASCAKTGKQEDHHHAEGTPLPTGQAGNQALYDQVMDIHDEVMPKAEDIYQLKKALQDKIANAPDLVAEKKKELEQVIALLDSADQSMMDWMHRFHPLPDSADQEKARAYLESEMERIKKVRELMNESIEKAKGTASKN